MVRWGLEPLTLSKPTDVCVQPNVHSHTAQCVSQGYFMTDGIRHCQASCLVYRTGAENLPMSEEKLTKKKPSTWNEIDGKLIRLLQPYVQTPLGGTSCCVFKVNRWLQQCGGRTTVVP